MADQLQLRGGTAAENDAFIGAAREVTVDTTSWSLRVHDGSTSGGHSVLSGTPSATDIVFDPAVNGNILTSVDVQDALDELTDITETLETNKLDASGTKTITGVTNITGSTNFTSTVDFQSVVQQDGIRLIPAVACCSFVGTTITSASSRNVVSISDGGVFGGYRVINISFGTPLATNTGVAYANFSGYSASGGGPLLNIVSQHTDANKIQILVTQVATLTAPTLANVIGQVVVYDRDR